MFFRHAIRPLVLGALAFVGLVALRQPCGAWLDGANVASGRLIVERVLADWEKASAVNSSFAWHFTHFHYDPTVQPPDDPAGPTSVASGELKFQAPDKVALREDRIRSWEHGWPTGSLVNVESQCGAHWACDGQRLYSVDHDRKEIVECETPSNWRFTGILPFAERIPFGIKSADLAARYEIEVVTPAARASTEIWLQMRARPRQYKNWLGLKATAHDEDVDVILRADDHSLAAIQVRIGSFREVWLFEPWHAPADGLAVDDSFSPSFPGYRVVVQRH